MDKHVARSFGGDGDRKRSYGIDTSCGLPHTLHVNQQSRRDTLKYYSIILRPGIRIEGINVGTCVRPICYNPKLDTMFFTTSYIMHDESWKWQHRIQEVSPTIFNIIEELEIRNWYCCFSLGLELAISLNLGELSKKLAFFFHFPGLRCLKIVLNKECSDSLAYTNMDTVKKADIMQGIEILLHKHDPQGTVSPKVTAESWNRLNSRVSYRNSIS